MNRQTIDTITTKVGLGDIIYVEDPGTATCNGNSLIAMLLSILTKEKLVLLYTLSLINKRKPQMLTNDAIIGIYKQSCKNDSIIKYKRSHFIPLVLNVNANDFFCWRAVNTGIKMLDMKNWPIMAVLAWAYNTDIINIDQTFRYGQNHRMLDMDKFISELRIKEGTVFNHRRYQATRGHIPNPERAQAIRSYIPNPDSVYIDVYNVDINGVRGIVKLCHPTFSTNGSYRVLMKIDGLDSTYTIGEIPFETIASIANGINDASVMSDILKPMIQKYIRRHSSDMLQ